MMTYILLGCERGGKYKRYKKDVDISRTGSRKCEYPFRLRGKPVKGGQGWMMELICGSHNHDLAKTMVGHPYAGRLSVEEKVMVEDMTKTSVKPKNILLTMKETNEKNVMTIKQVYNAMIVHRISQQDHRIEMQQFMLLLERDRYVHWCRCDEVSNVVQDIFWTHSDSVKLVNSFNIVILMDTTYKTNKYRMSLLEVVGIMSTGLTFPLHFVYYQQKRKIFFCGPLT